MSPLAEKFPNMSPYGFCNNNHLYFVMLTETVPYDDIIINTKKKSTSFVRTNDKFDRVFKDGKFVGKTTKGFAETLFKEKGKLHTETSHPEGVGMGAVDGAIIFLLTAGTSRVFSLLSSVFKSATVKVVTNVTANIAVNATTQYIANGRNIGDINMFEAGLSGVPRIGRGLMGELAPVVIGETFSYSANNIKRGDGIQKPNTFEKWSTQVGGGILSFGFGKVTDNHLAGEGVGGLVVGGFFKGFVETGSNAAPNLINEE
ncbi:hypothetical protein [Flavobacterium sp.]|uniref:hypothetical protein n=1 Tax=Flavobacterium sp. TaxID=239 RepID=UPI00286E365E|nr:hypothetical protein [Flavobacterium sp.]